MMARLHLPKSARARWLDTAPDYVLDCFDNGGKTADRYTVALILDGADNASYLGMSSDPTSPQGFSQWGEFAGVELTNYRYHYRRHRVRWLDLPDHIRKHVRARVEEA